MPAHMSAALPPCWTGWRGFGFWTNHGGGSAALLRQ